MMESASLDGATHAQVFSRLVLPAPMLLPLAVFFSLQQYFVRGILSGSVKG